MKKIFKNPIIDTPEALNELCVKLSKTNAIAVDTEFIREKTFFPIIALIQIGARVFNNDAKPEMQTWIIDPIALDKAALEPLLAILKNPKVLKIMHAASADQECFYTSFGVLATPLFDTAQAASLLGYGDQPGLAKLVKEFFDISLDKGHSRTDWTARPLQDQLLKYAHQDVLYLIEMTEKLMARLKSKKRLEWAFELSKKFEDARLYDQPAEDIAKRAVRNRTIDRRVYATLIELIRWREERVRELDLPRKWVADDDLLTSLAAVRPKDMVHLSAFRGLNKGELKHSGERILEAVKRAAAIADKDLPSVPRVESPEDHEERAIDVLNLAIKILADKNEIAPKYLISSDALLQAIRKGPFTDPAGLVKAGILSQGAADLIGSELVDFLSGTTTIAISGNTVVFK